MNVCGNNMEIPLKIITFTQHFKIISSDAILMLLIIRKGGEDGLEYRMIIISDLLFLILYSYYSRVSYDDEEESAGPFIVSFLNDNYHVRKSN